MPHKDVSRSGKACSTGHRREASHGIEGALPPQKTGNESAAPKRGTWDNFLDSPSVDMPEREQPQPETREEF